MRGSAAGATDEEVQAILALRRRCPFKAWPASSTTGALLERHGLVPDAELAQASEEEGSRVSPASPRV